MSKDKIHQKYLNQIGQQVPGVTSVISVLAKPALVPWAWGLGVKGIDYRKYVDDKAEIGTLAHALIMAELSGEKLKADKLADYTPNQLDLAENCVLSALEWLRHHKLEDYELETQLVCEKYQFGGTPDFYGKVDGIWTVLDFKTGKGIYGDMWYQVAGYATAKAEAGKQVNQIMIINVPRSEDENFTVGSKTEWVNEEEIFLACLQIYQAQKRIKKEEK